MIEEKIFKCRTFYQGYRSIEEVIKEVNIELEKGYHIVAIEQVASISVRDLPEADLTITLRKNS